jgi:hypothetical protein
MHGETMKHRKLLETFTDSSVRNKLRFIAIIRTGLGMMVRTASTNFTSNVFTLDLTRNAPAAHEINTLFPLRGCRNTFELTTTNFVSIKKDSSVSIVN